MTEGISRLADGFGPYAESDWRLLVEKALKGTSFDSLNSTTDDGLTLAPLYHRSVPRHIDGRGANRWDVIQRIDHPDPEDANRFALDDLKNGATALSLVFRDSASGHGYGLATDAATIARALEGVYLNMIRLRIEPHASARKTAHAVAEAVTALGYTPDAVAVRFGLDPFGNFARWGALNALDAVAEAAPDTVARLAKAGFTGPFMEADGRPYHDAGATAGQELAAVLATVVGYLRFGIPATAIGITVAADADQFETIAKTRALRLLWARLLEVCGLEPVSVAVHAETSWRMMTVADPHTNMLRATIATFSAAVGGADSIAVLPFTAALGLADGFARRAARNTQLVLSEESNLYRVADPAAGSGALEKLTDDLAATAWRYFQDIEGEGGIVESLVSGSLQARIIEARDARQQDYREQERAIIGTTVYPNAEPVSVDTLPVERSPEPQFKSHPLTCTPLHPLRVAAEFEAA